MKLECEANLKIPVKHAARNLLRKKKTKACRLRKNFWSQVPSSNFVCGVARAKFVSMHTFVSPRFGAVILLYVSMHPILMSAACLVRESEIERAR